MRVAVAFVVGGTVLLGVACGGTLEEDYRRGRLRPSEPPAETPEGDTRDGDDDEARTRRTAHPRTNAAARMGGVGEAAPRVRS